MDKDYDLWDRRSIGFLLNPLIFKNKIFVCQLYAILDWCPILLEFWKQLLQSESSEIDIGNQISYIKDGAY